VGWSTHTKFKRCSCFQNQVILETPKGGEGKSSFLLLDPYSSTCLAPFEPYSSLGASGLDRFLFLPSLFSYDTRMESTTEIGKWATFAEGKEAIEFMTLAELEAWSGKPQPSLLPFSGWAIPLGFILFFALQFNPVLQLISLLVSLYGAIAVFMNRSKAAEYKADLYRRWVQDKAAQMEDENNA
jgi:hypothetical protein